ncbi:MAG: beta-galactosidase [Pseudomonadota bacterium]
MRQLGVCYYPEQWPREMWPRDAARMVAAGITIVRIGEFAWSRIEPAPGRFDWAWLDDAFEVLSAHNLKIVLGTPTATPPRWMLTKHPDMLPVDANGRPRRFGSRRHVDFSHRAYREEAVRIATLYAERYGRQPALTAWQTDNEYGCHDTVHSYSDAAHYAFIDWLREKYGTVAALNTAWGTVFWSMELSSFEEVALPYGTVTEPNPAHALDYRRFASDEVVAFNRAQVDAIRAHSDRPISHNFMGRVLEFDHFAVGADLDIATWDSYPLGFLEDRISASDQHKRTYARTGDPDFQAFHHDLYRAVCRGRWWVMEQQPGPVNWAPHNPAPAPGMVRLWHHEAFAHGAEVVATFRWRQAFFAQEQMHAGLLRSDDQPAPGLAEVTATGREIATLPPQAKVPADVALAFDYRSHDVTAVMPHGTEANAFDLSFAAYRALRRLGLSVDIVPGSLEGSESAKLLLLPGLATLTDAARARLAGRTAPALLGPRTNAKSASGGLPARLPPDLAPLLGLTVTAVESLRPDMPIPHPDGAVHLWREFVEAAPAVTIRSATLDGHPFHLAQGPLHYLAGWPDDALFVKTLAMLCAEAGIATTPMPGGLRRRSDGRTVTYVNYGPDAHDLSAFEPGAPRLGTLVCAPHDVAIFDA